MQSYNNLAVSTILAASDEILGVSSIMQKLGTSLSGEQPASTIAAGLTLAVRLDNEAASQNITLAANDDLLDIAEDIQAKVRLLTPLGLAPLAAFTGFTARWDSVLNKLVLTSGTSTTAPLTTAVAITGGTAAALLNLGLAEGGTESKTGAEVISYTVKYRFVFDGGRSFGSADVVVHSSQMTTPTSLAEVESIANARASQIKAEATASVYTSEDDSSLIGPVSL